MRITLAAAMLAATPAVAQAQSDDTSSPALTGTTTPQGWTSDIIVTATPTVAEATRQIERTPGAVEVVPDTAFKNTPVQTIKDILQYVPGVIVQPRMGDDVRLSIRGSGLSRAYATSTKQRIPGEVSKDQALGDPRSANPEWVRQDQQRNVRSIRVANKTTARLGDTTVEAGIFYNNRHVRRPIYQWLDFTVDDYGAFVRAVDDRSIGSVRNRLIVGANLQNGTIDTEQFVNLTGAVSRWASMPC